LSAPAPLAVYLHWPYCARICPYCDFNVVRERGRVEEQAQLVAAMVADLRAQRTLTGERRLVSVFFGGGTPSLMDPRAVERLLREAKELWSPVDDLEVSLEANPTDAEAGRFEDLARAGVNRLSLGVQSFDDTELKLLFRNHDAEAAQRAVDQALLAVRRVSIDLIYALPNQTLDAWSGALRKVASLGVEHVSPYQLTIEAGTAFDRAVNRGRLVPPDDARAAKLYEVTQDVLGQEGFDAYEVSNHARGAAAQSRHNLAYWRGEDYLGAGPGAHGRLTLDGRRLATETAAKPQDYIDQVAAAGFGWTTRDVLLPEQVATERLLMGLRIDAPIPWPELAPLGLTPTTAKVAELAQLRLIKIDSNGLAATRAGRRVLDQVTRSLCLP
jgi:putative oxygen-independent coproporphyrinogen III oxidase